MLKKAIKKRIHNYHPWRTIKFDELAEIYISMSLRSFGISAIGVFVPIFLYKSGVSLVSIAFFFVYFFGFRALSSFYLAKIVGRLGPKHAIGISNIIYVFFLAMLLSYESMAWPLPIIAIFFSVANGIFFISYHTDFSKVKHQSHGGKELGWLYVFERTGSAIGPVVGGVLAGIYNPQISILFAMAVILISLVPLFLTNEPVKAHQKVSYKVLDHKSIMRNDIPSIASFNIVNVVHAAFWPLFIGVFIFQDRTYEALGLLLGIATVISMISARLYGRLVDRYHGLQLLRFGVYTTSMINILRVVASQPAAAVGITAAAEPLELAARLPLVKSFYDEADTHDSSRISYIAFTEQIVAIAKAGVTLLFAAFLLFFDDKLSFQLIFLVGSVVSFGMLRQKFAALKKKG